MNPTYRVAMTELPPVITPGITPGITTVIAPDARELEVLTGGDPDGFPLLFHSGSPSAAVRDATVDRQVAEAGLRLVTYSRPGYGGSTRRQRPEPRMVDDVADAVSILDALGVAEFLTLGWSGGGPRALACAAVLPGRCRAAATLAGVGPKDGDGLDWFAGMAQENVAEYAAAAQGEAAYSAHLVEEFLPMQDVTGEQVADGLGGLVTPVDTAFITGEFADWMAATFRGSLAQGVVGAVDDGLAAVAPWGYDLASITVPVSVWQGAQDAMVPFAHGQWLAAHVPGATAHLFEDEGHLSLLAKLPEILADLKASAGLR
jgi:pimeloyl-ACP methyl ester carboxylesterase